MNNVSDSCVGEIIFFIKLKGDIESIDDLKISKESLHTIVLKLKKSINAKDIDQIKESTFKLISNNQEKLENLSNSFKLKNKNKTDLKKFVKDIYNIDKSGKLLKVLMKLK
jgi:NhaP-type Na+/H+ and K+/H+ antiporter